MAIEMCIRRIEQKHGQEENMERVQKIRVEKKRTELTGSSQVEK